MAIAASNAFTVPDLEALPEDGTRYELIGGAIVMSPSPELVHQRVSRRLLAMIEAACPPEHEVFDAPVDLDLPGGQRLVPDIVVAPYSSLSPARVTGPALLVVEIVSPGSRSHDYVAKRALYATAGAPAYWIVDPSRGHVLALRMVGPGYAPYVDATGLVHIDWPVKVSFDVQQLARQ